MKMSDTDIRSEQRLLWGLCYRLTGVAADADEIVQETFTRALQRDGIVGQGRPWLVRVATNLSLDLLRARKRRGYPSSWLPSPVETEGEESGEWDASTVGHDVEARYERAESLSYAFLIALEALGPRSRAVLILRDVLDYSAGEVADVLATSEANVRIIHHRARKRMERYDRERRPSLRTLAQETRRALESFLGCLARQDAAGLGALLAETVRTVTDGGGRYTALRRPLVGRAQVASFHLKTAKWRAPVSQVDIRWINGLPAAVIATVTARASQAPRLVLRCEIDGDGKIREVQSVLAPRKLTAVRFDDL